MAVRQAFVLGDTVSVDNSGLLIGGRASVVGTGAIWKDGSDSTYAEILTQMNGPGQPQFGSNAGCSIAAAPDGIASASPSLASLVARIRVAALEPALPYPWVEVRRSGASVTGYASGECPLVPTWVDITLSGDQMSTVFTEALTFNFFVQSAFKSEAGGEKYWRIYEAQLFLVRPSADAPPCRIFPRSDGLGVGAGRAWPPPRSQQRSPGNRGVGYY